MRWLRGWQMRRAAMKYAARLGPHLRRAYGAAEHYSPAQIRASVSRLGLSERYIVIAYAAFLPPDAFAALAGGLPVSLSYDDAQAIFDRFRPTALRSIGGNPGPEYDPPDIPGNSG